MYMMYVGTMIIDIICGVITVCVLTVCQSDCVPIFVNQSCQNADASWMEEENFTLLDVKIFSEHDSLASPVLKY